MPPEKNTIHLAFADDHALVRNGVVNLLSSLNISVDTEAANGHELIQALDNTDHLPDICIIDLHMPIMDGFEAIYEISRRWPKMKKLALSLYDDEYYVIRAISSGADGFVTKSAPLSVLERAIHTLHNGGIFYSEEIDNQYIQHIRTKKIKLPKLTAHEKELLMHCCSDLSYPQIADKMKVSVRSVDWYRDSLFKKLNVCSRSSLVIYAIKLGIVFVEAGSLSWMLE